MKMHVLRFAHRNSRYSQSARVLFAPRCSPMMMIDVASRPKGTAQEYKVADRKHGENTRSGAFRQHKLAYPFSRLVIQCAGNVDGTRHVLNSERAAYVTACDLVSNTGGCEQNNHIVIYFIIFPTSKTNNAGVNHN